MADNINFQKLVQSIKSYVEKMLKGKSNSDHSHDEYVKKTDLSNVALSGSYLDLEDLPLDDIIISDEDIKVSINAILGDNYYE